MPEVKVLVYNNTYHIMVNGKDVYWRVGIGPEYHDKTVAMFNSMAVIIVSALEAVGFRPTLITWQ